MKSKLSRVTTKKRFRKRIVRYGLLTGNIAIVAIAILFVVHQPKSDAVKRSVTNVANSQASNPLDALSAADIAVNASRMLDLAESISVVNQADSVKAELTTPASDTAVVNLPQILSSQIKTKADIQEHVVQSGDTLGSLATKFGVTSDSIKWSNNIGTASLIPGKKLIIPPVNGIAYVVKSGDTAENLATKFRADKDQIVTFNDAEVLGLRVGEKIVIPNGTIQAPAVAASTRFAFGTAAIYGRSGSNGYDYGWCTWYVQERRTSAGKPVPNNLGNAATWYTIARNAGLPTGATPAVGAVAVIIGGNHVSYVERVNEDGSFWVSEMNASGQRSIDDPTPAGGWGRVNYKLYRSPGNIKFIY